MAIDGWRFRRFVGIVLGWLVNVVIALWYVCSYVFVEYHFI